MTTQSTSLATSLSRKTDPARLARRVAGDARLLEELFHCLDSNVAAVKFGSDKILRILTETRPEVVYPKIRLLIDRLGSDNNVLRWGALIALGNLASVDTKKKIDAVLDRYFAGIKGPVMITAANTVKGAVNIALAKPYLVEDIVTQLLKVEKGTYQSEECKHIALGQTIEALGRLFERVDRKKRVANFVTRQLDNPRPSTRKKAEKFLARWVG